jgi:hypothetical protein
LVISARASAKRIHSWLSCVADDLNLADDSFDYHALLVTLRQIRVNDWILLLRHPMVSVAIESVPVTLFDNVIQTVCLVACSIQAAGIHAPLAPVIDWHIKRFAPVVAVEVETLQFFARAGIQRKTTVSS